jgi:hypothetical protein
MQATHAASGRSGQNRNCHSCQDGKENGCS